MKAHEGRSTAESLEVGATVLAADIDSPVSTPSSHSSWFASMSRTSAGTRSPTLRLTTSPGTSSRTSRRRGVPSRCTTVSWRMFACSAATASSERYSLTKPSPTLKTTIVAMIAPSTVSPVAAEIAGGGQQQDQQRVAELTGEDAERGDPVRRHDVRAERRPPSSGLGGGEPSFGRAQVPKHVGHRLAGRDLEGDGCRGSRHRSSDRRHLLPMPRVHSTRAHRLTGPPTRAGGGHGQHGVGSRAGPPVDGPCSRLSSDGIGWSERQAGRHQPPHACAGAHPSLSGVTAPEPLMSCVTAGCPR